MSPTTSASAPTSVTRPHRESLTDDQVKVVNDWLAACQVAWIVAPSGKVSDDMETAMLNHRFPRLNRAEKRRRT